MDEKLAVGLIIASAKVVYCLIVLYFLWTINDNLEQLKLMLAS